ncbi:MAG TPA: PepSY-associated TM helix domain-containing protein [Novosphingobium sp.]|nr:PepSY-associated TM helix domain-containing protein [Novosphingobium sp.]
MTPRPALPPLTRQFWVIAHRWAGLTLALFLAVAGFTGIFLSWNAQLEAMTAPHLLRASPPAASAPMRDPAQLAAQAQARHPGMIVTYLPLTVHPGESLHLRVMWQNGAPHPNWDELFINPWTGAELGHRHWGDIGEGWVNLMPLVYRLHYSLLLGESGELAMGLAALVWTLDCFVGFWLTLPVKGPVKGPIRQAQAKRQPGWWARWRPSWAVRWGASGYKLNFDLHRAGGLWVWPALLVFAWSSVSFNLPGVYNPIMRQFGARDTAAAIAAHTLPAPRLNPALGLAAAKAGPNMAPGGTTWLWHAPAQGAYYYGFTTRSDVPDEGGASRLMFDSNTGQLIGTDIAGARPAANTATEWLGALHMARVGGMAWRVAVTVLGAVVTMLCITGIVIWMRKRSGRVSRRAKLRPGSPQRGSITRESMTRPSTSRAV